MLFKVIAYTFPAELHIVAQDRPVAWNLPLIRE